jgi:antitoxin (DNA-binding transcriptional repressor) of toxin-antitoxin stability system
MPAYSVADAQTNLPRLIDRALGGEEVIITRYGKPVAELRPAGAPHRQAAPATYTWLQSRRKARSRTKLSSVELLNNLADDSAVRS